MSQAVQRVRVIRIGRNGPNPENDQAAVEEPLEVRLDGEPFAVVMRTPGDDQDLVAGFLLGEGVITEPDQIRTIGYGADSTQARQCNVIDVALDGVDVSARLGERRRVAMTAACGLCGRSTIESLKVVGRDVDRSWRIGAATVSALPMQLTGHQDGFARTGGLHAAGLFDPDGRLDGCAEDIGRHNAVDKVVGRRLLDGRFPVGDRMLFVSGRVSFEIVQKAWIAGIPCVGAVSAPSSLAVELAREAGITLIGFVRDGRFNIYAHEERVI